MILVDAGPLVALFDPRDPSHKRCRSIVRHLREDLLTTLPVLTEAAHFLGTESRGFRELAGLVAASSLGIEFLSRPMLTRAFELLDKYRDRAMDLADASLVVTAEARSLRRIWSLDRADFSTYRIRRGHGFEQFELLD